MSDLPHGPSGPDDPFEGLPEELRRMMEQLGGSGLFSQLQGAMAGPRPEGPVDWRLARRVALEIAADGDRSPHDPERARFEEAQRIAEHWLDASALPAPPDGGRVLVTGRTEWIDAALTTMRPLIEPVARASSSAMAELAQQQLGEIDLEAMGLGSIAGLLGGLGDLSEMLRPVGAVLMGLQSGQVIGQLSRQLLGQYELGLPTAPRAVALHLAVNIAETFEGWDLDPTEVAIVVALNEGAYRRLYHAVPWLEAHLHGLVAQFANGTELDPDRLRDVTQELMLGVDPDDPDAMRAAMEQAASFTIEPTPAQQRVLERIQGVVALVQSWARREVLRAVGTRLPHHDRIGEVLRRRRATKGDGEEQLERLLGLDLKPEPDAGDAFVTAVEDAHGPEGLREALAHPENLPDAEELADPSRWLERMSAGRGVPDDASSLFEGLGDAPQEPSAEERGRGDEGGDATDGAPDT